MDTPMPLSVPKYRHVKNTFEIFDARVSRLDKMINVNTKYINRMKDIRNRVRKLLMSHKMYNELDFIIMNKSDPINGDIPDETLEKLQKLSKPRQRDLKETLMKVNQMIRAITSDHYYKENNYKLNRYAELMEYRKNICCLLKNAKFPTEIRPCFRFASCEKKIINIWQIPTGDKPYSRILKVDFDETTIKLAHPQLLYILNTITFFLRLRYYYIQKANEIGRWTDKELNQIYTTIDNINKKLIHLQQLEQIAKTSSLYHEVISEPSAENKTIMQYTHSIDLPKRKRLEDALKTYQSYLVKIQKRTGYRKKQETLVEGRIQPLVQRIERNIMFTHKLLDILPQDEAHCQTESYNFNDKGEKKIVYPIFDESGHIVNYNYDERTNELAFPKIGNLEGSLQVHKNVLEKFENDIKNINQVMKSNTQGESKNESDDNYEIEDSSLKSNKPDKYQQLKERINRLNALIQQKRETIEYLQSVLPQPGVRSTFYHHKLCFKEEKKRKPIPSSYKAKNLRSPISTSKASTKYLESSFNSYIKWIEQKRNDIKYRDDIESILNSQNTCEILMLNDENQEDEEEKGFGKQEKILTHTQRMIQNKLKLETYLESIKLLNANDVHWQTHAKFEKLLRRMEPKSMGSVNKERIIELATPKRTLLKFSIVRFRHLMSENKRRRLECRLSKSLSKPEQIECEFRQKESQKKPKSQKKFNTNERAALNQLMNKIINSKSLTEDSTNLDDLIRYSILNGLQYSSK
ncbi:unnamed protein product [Chironomus riparius]|uniref:Uncharacterized protein n=1 Tax=Chironomus riparius TaxID=315576 RepID=A0A9N9WPL3_9DIPT|nr:unnamed protein product [Chironomus riparius]